jgi:hypothetical protein
MDEESWTLIISGVIRGEYKLLGVFSYKIIGKSRASN